MASKVFTEHFIDVIHEKHSFNSLLIALLSIAYFISSKTEACVEEDISESLTDMAFVPVQEDTIDEAVLETLNNTSLDVRELNIDAVLMEFTTGEEVPDSLTYYVAYREDDNSRVILVLGDDNLPFPVRSGTDLTPELKDKRVASLVLFLPNEGIQGTDGVTLDVDDIVNILADSVTVKVCGTLMQSCFSFHSML